MIYGRQRRSLLSDGYDISLRPSKAPTCPPSPLPLPLWPLCRCDLSVFAVWDTAFFSCSSVTTPVLTLSSTHILIVHVCVFVSAGKQHGGGEHRDGGEAGGQQMWLLGSTQQRHQTCTSLHDTRCCCCCFSLFICEEFTVPASILQCMLTSLFPIVLMYVV